MNPGRKKLLQTFLFVLALFFISRVGIYTAGYFGYNLFSKYDVPSSYQSSPGEGTRMELPLTIGRTYFLRPGDFVKFDSGYYIKLAEKGYDRYRMDEKHPAADWPFFPLFPILMSLVHLVIPLKLGWIGFFLSNTFAVLSMYFLFRIAEEWTGDEDTGKKALIYLMLFPTSLYLSMIYTESLFLLLSTLTVFLTIEKKYDWAILAASLSTVTRIPGIANLVFIAFILWKEAGFNPLRIRIRYYIEMVMSCFPLLAFFTYMKLLTGDFLAVFHELSLNWGREAATPFKGYFDYFRYRFFVTPAGWDLSLASFVFTTLILLVYAVYMINQRKKLEICFYGLILILIPLSGSSFAFTSAIRYYMVSFPLFIILADYFKRRPLAEFAAMLMLVTFNIIYTIGFVNNYTFTV